MLEYIDDSKEIVTDFLSEYDELAKLFPYAKPAIAVYKFVRVNRMKRFLKTLSKTQDILTPNKKALFRKILESNEGQELLAEYVDAVINTSSKTANIALALLYSDTEHENFEKSFKNLATLALKGITEDSVDLFLTLVENQKLMKKSDTPPYPLWTCDENFITHIFDADSEFRDATVLYSSMGDLIHRRLFAPDYALGRFADPGIIIPFGITKTSLFFYRLLDQAKVIGKQLE